MTVPRQTGTPGPRELLEELSSRDRVDQAANRRLAQQALDLARQRGDALLTAEALLGRSRHLTTLIDPVATFAEVQEASRIFRANGLRARDAACQVAAGRALYDMGRERHAAAMAHAALQEAQLTAVDRVRAFVLLFKSQGRMGRLEEAYAFLDDQALPLARLVGDPQLLAHVLQLKGWLFGRLAISARNADLPLPGYRVLADVALGTEPLAHALSILDEAQRCLPPTCAGRGIEVDRIYILGLGEGAGAGERAATRLKEVADEVMEIDPPLAALTLFNRAMLLHGAGRFEETMPAITEALGIARENGLSGIARDLLFLRSIACEATGDFAGALDAIKEHLRLITGPSTSGDAPQYDWPGIGAGPAKPQRDADSKPLQRELEPACLKRATRWIDQRAGTPIRIADVIAACNVSRRTLDAAFRASKDMTLSGYIKGKQIELAAEQLLYTGRTVREIAESIGYRSPTMFAREFRDRLGLAPAQWRGMVAPPVRSPEVE